MADQVQPSPWGPEVKEVKEEVSVETPKSSKYTYLFIILVCLLFLTLGGIVYVVYRSNTQVASSIVSSSSTSNESYSTYNDKYVSFEYPSGAMVEVRQSGSEYSSLSIENKILTLGLAGPASSYGKYGYNYDTNNPNKIYRYEHAEDYQGINKNDGEIELSASQLIYRNTDADIIGINVDSNLVLLGKEIENPSANKYQIGQDGDYTVLSWKWGKIPSSYSSMFFTCNLKEREEMLKCTEVLDRFITTFKVK